MPVKSYLQSSRAQISYVAVQSMQGSGETGKNFVFLFLFIPTWSSASWAPQHVLPDMIPHNLGELLAKQRGRQNIGGVRGWKHTRTPVTPPRASSGNPGSGFLYSISSWTAGFLLTRGRGWTRCRTRGEDNGGGGSGGQGRPPSGVQKIM